MPFLPPNQQRQSTEGNTAQKKIDKYSKLASTHIFYPFAIETAGTWHEMAIEPRDWQAYHKYHKRYPGDSIPFPTPFHVVIVSHGQLQLAWDYISQFQRTSSLRKVTDYVVVEDKVTRLN